MTCRKVMNDSFGYSLVELLVTVVIMGLVVTAIYGLHESMQKAEQTGEVVGELQQNLRVGMEFITNDVQLTGFLVPPGTPPIQNDPTPIAPATELDEVVGTGCFDDGNWPVVDATDADACLNMRTATPNGLVARVVEDAGGATGGQTGATTRTINIASSAMAEFFTDGNEVRIIRPGSSLEVVDPPKTFAVDAVNLSSDPAIPSTIAFTDFAAADPDILAGDMLVQTDDAHPNTIAYFLLGTDFMRQENDDAPQVVAENVSGLVVTCQRDSGGGGLEDIRAVQVEIQGQGSFHETDVKTRAVRSTIRLRNR